MKRVLMNDILGPVEPFELFPRKKHTLPAWIRALFHRTPRARLAYVRTAVAKY